MSLQDFDFLSIKANLIAGSFIHIDKGLVEYSKSKDLSLSHTIRVDNLYSYPWIFIRLNNTSRVRMIVTNELAPLKLLPSKNLPNNYDIYNAQDQLVIGNITIEDVLYHCPKQLFYDLYEFCFMNCKFCPLSAAPRWTRDTLEKILDDISRINIEEIDGIGLTSGIPAHLSGDKVAAEMAQMVRKIRTVIGDKIPIGVSPMHPSRDILLELRDAGVNEVRINLETNNQALANLIIPNKTPKKTIESIQEAVSIFGTGKVSSNIVVGIGEEDEDVIEGIEVLAMHGAIATIYPYDVVPSRQVELEKLTNGKVGRPNSVRLLMLAHEHKKILDKYSLNPNLLMTMCPRCSASHLMPGKDL